MSKENEKSKLEKLKENYSGIQKKHNLPEFDELNEDFHIEKIADSDTDFLLMEIRKMVGDKLTNYLKFCETMLNPSNAGMFVFSMVKALDTDSKSKITEIYKKLSEYELDFIGLDMVSSEEKEAEFIKRSFKEWQGMKSELSGIIEKIKKNWNGKTENGSKQYFG